MDKDWNERFERGHDKSRHWRIAVGLILIGLKVTQYVAPAPNLLAPMNRYEQIGGYFGNVAFLALACWLIYSGFRAKKIKIPPDSK
jgi:hypothetical protein